MNSGAIWLVLGRAIGFVSLGSAAFVCALVSIRRKWPSLAVRTITAIGLILGVTVSIWLVSRLAESRVSVPQSDGLYVYELWFHPSPVLAAIPAVVGIIAGGIYSIHLRRREGGRVA